MTVELDITELKAFVESRGYSTYANLCYFFTRAARSIEDFRYRVKDERIVLYDEIHVGMTVPAPGGLFSFAYVDYDPDVERYNRTAKAAMASSSDEASLAEEEHDNYIYFTALPGVPFTGFTHAFDEWTGAAPNVAFGKFRRSANRLLVPIGVQINHIFIDGNALGELYERAREAFANPS
jgi:chloramphenicol O-acetyltransferase type A